MRVALFLVFVLVLRLCLVTAILPSRKQWLWSRAIADALSDARSVTLVEFSPDYYEPRTKQYIRREVVLKRVNATAKEIADLRSATGSFFVFRFRAIMAMCFDPHHRVDVVRRDGSSFRLEICFECGNFAFDKGSGRIPLSWYRPLRLLFTGVGMPPLASDGYERLAEEKMKETPQEAGPDL